MDDVTGAVSTKRCPCCAGHKTREHFTPSSWRMSGSYCRECRASKTRQWRADQRVMSPLPSAELERLRRLVSCMVCGAVPQVVGVDRYGRDLVRAPHTDDCTAADQRLKRTG